MPSSKQTRRSISVRGTTYDTLRRFCEEQNRSMSDVVEEQLAKVLAAKPMQAPKPIHAPRPVAKARPTVAPKIVRAVTPAPQPPSLPVSVSGKVGRPAPIPASEVVQPRVHAPWCFARKRRRACETRGASPRATSWRARSWRGSSPH